MNEGRPDQRLPERECGFAGKSDATGERVRSLVGPELPGRRRRSLAAVAASALAEDLEGRRLAFDAEASAQRRSRNLRGTLV